MAKWLAVVAFILALVARFAWHGSTDIAIPVSSDMHRGFPINVVVFWLFLGAGLLSFGIAFRNRAH